LYSICSLIKACGMKIGKRSIFTTPWPSCVKSTTVPVFMSFLAAGGQLTQVSYETPSKLKSIVGPFAYYIKGFEMLPQMKAVD
ncbi:hypothetical protein P7584_15570, partial [Staphylococcus aureus]|nr:hypothetical protein [Staphylococcus aureus]